MNEKWMPGPWEIWEYKDQYSDKIAVEIAKDGAIIAKLGVETDVECVANKHLIAAAPELWAALAAIVEHDEYVIECGVMMPFVELERAKAALKKARGE